MSIYLKTICDDSYRNPIYVGDFEACKEQGEASGDQVIRRSDNPYPAGSGEYDSWDFGWTHSLTQLCGEK